MEDRQHANSWARAAGAAVLVLTLGACTDDSGNGTERSSASPGEPTYATGAFRMPFEVDVPSWSQGEVSVDSENFVTWDSADPADPAVRFLLPVSVYRPGDRATTTPPPADYLGYLLSQEESGARFTDLSEGTVGGHSATLVTATAAEPLEGSLGCPAAGLRAEDCFGLQPDLTLRLAVIEVEGETLVAWLRHTGAPDSGGATHEFADFEQLLESLEFLDRAPTSTGPTEGSTASPLDGVWATSFSQRALARSSLLYDPDEVNDQNWGNFTLTLEDGQFTYAQENPLDSYTAQGTFTVEGDVLRLVLDNLEVFEMRFTVSGDTLTLERDDSLGIAPTPFVLRPWVG